MSGIYRLCQAQTSEKDRHDSTNPSRRITLVSRLRSRLPTFSRSSFVMIVDSSALPRPLAFTGEWPSSFGSLGSAHFCTNSFWASDRRILLIPVSLSSEHPSQRTPIEFLKLRRPLRRPVSSAVRAYRKQAVEADAFEHPSSVQPSVRRKPPIARFGGALGRRAFGDFHEGVDDRRFLVFSPFVLPHFWYQFVSKLVRKL